MIAEYTTFEQFYPFYLSQHANQTNRRLHIIGTLLAIILLIRAIFSGGIGNYLIVPIVGYGFAWVGHFMFEKNKPATFKYPLFSFRGDLRMLQ
jgi:hypothetical protein